MLKIYTNKTFLTEQYRRQIFPLLLDLFFLKSKTILKYYSLIDTVEECDVVLSPLDYSCFNKTSTSFKELQGKAKAASKPLWIFTGGDYGFTNNYDNVITFRLGGFKSKLPESTFIFPSFVSDPYKILKQDFNTIKKTNLPQLGFVGHADASFNKYIKEAILYFKRGIKNHLSNIEIDRQKFYPSGYKRGNYLNSFKRSSKLKTDFIYRKQYRAGAKNEEDKKKTTLEFYDNMYRNPYTFCMRGEGNFSVRFYETIAMGRIPIVLDTDFKLPLDALINWEEHCLIIKDNRGESLITQIINFHNSITPVEFNQMQERNRKLWINLLSREPFFIAMYSFFKNNFHDA